MVPYSLLLLYSYYVCSHTKIYLYYLNYFPDFSEGGGMLVWVDMVLSFPCCLSHGTSSRLQERHFWMKPVRCITPYFSVWAKYENREETSSQSSFIEIICNDLNWICMLKGTVAMLRVLGCATGQVAFFGGCSQGVFIPIMYDSRGIHTFFIRIP